MSHTVCETFGTVEKCLNFEHMTSMRLECWHPSVVYVNNELDDALSTAKYFRDEWLAISKFQ